MPVDHVRCADGCAPDLLGSEVRVSERLEDADVSPGDSAPCPLLPLESAGRRPLAGTRCSGYSLEAEGRPCFLSVLRSGLQSLLAPTFLLLSLYRGIPNYEFKLGKITFIRNSRPLVKKVEEVSVS